jgi:Domain of unknown function (DUF4397)
MNNSKNKFYSFGKALGILSLSALLIVSCKKDNNDAPPSIPPASLAIAHVSPGSPELELKINGTKVPKMLNYGTFVSYDLLRSGKQEFSINKKGGTDVLAKTMFNLSPNKAYSVYIADTLSKPMLFLTEDDLTIPATGKAKIRFINLSPDAGDLDVSVTGQAKALFSKTSYKSSTEFIQVDPAAELNLAISSTGKTIALATSKVKIEKDKIYTIWAKGLLASSDSTKLGITLITNK